VFYNYVLVTASINQALAATVNAFTGISMGEKNVRKAKRFLVTGLMITLVLIIMNVFLLIFLPTQIVNVYTHDEDVMRVTLNLFRIYMFLLPIDYVQATLAGFVRGVGKEIIAFLGFIVCYYVIGLPIAYVLGDVVGMYTVGLRLGIGVASLSVLVWYLWVLGKTDFEVQVQMIAERLRADRMTKN